MAEQKDTSAFVGVSDIYKNYADDTTRPFLPDGDERTVYEEVQEAEKASVVDEGSDRGRAQDSGRGRTDEPAGADEPKAPEPKAETRTAKAKAAAPKPDPEKA